MSNSDAALQAYSSAMFSLIPGIGQLAGVAQAAILYAMGTRTPTIAPARQIPGAPSGVLFNPLSGQVQFSLQHPASLELMRRALSQDARAATIPTQPAGGAPMSLLGDIGRAVLPGVGAVIGAQFPSFGSAAGQAIGSSLAQISAAHRMAPAAGPQTVAFPALGAIAGTVGRAAGIAVGAVSLGVRAVSRSAAAYCRRNPAWCAQIGGVAAVAALVQNGQLPPMRRRRARGITASEFRGFRRVHATLSGFCAPRMRIRRKR